MLLCSIKPQSFCRQNFLSILLTSVARLDSSGSSARVVILEMAVEIPSCSTMRARSTISSAHWREELVIRRLLVPTWIIIVSGLRLTSGLMWSIMSAVEQPGKPDTWTFDCGSDKLRPCRCFNMESPAIIVDFLDLFGSRLLFPLTDDSRLPVLGFIGCFLTARCFLCLLWDTFIKGMVSDGITIILAVVRINTFSRSGMQIAKNIVVSELIAQQA